MKKLLVGVLVLAPLVWGYFSFSGADVYTLYRSSVSDLNAAGHSGMRIHIATFDSTDGGTYNQENCDVARKLFQQQPGVAVNYWCEKGRYKR
jgi:hypothetical protein